MQSQQRRHTSCYPPLCLHKSFPIHFGIPILKPCDVVGVRLSALLLQTFIIERDARVSSLRLTGLVKIAQPNL
jgi:hypothetical protein